MNIGEFILSKEPIELNEGRETASMKVRNTGDRPIQIGSHFHFFEVNRALEFDREAALGMHLNIPSGSAIRFEPGDEKNIELVAYGGMRRVMGFNNLVNGSVTAKWTVRKAILQAQELGFSNTPAKKRELVKSQQKKG